MARISISKAVTTIAPIWIRVDPRGPQGWDGRMMRQNRRPTMTKLGPISQFITQSWLAAQSKTTGRCHTTITPLKRTMATMGLESRGPDPTQPGRPGRAVVPAEQPSPLIDRNGEEERHPGCADDQQGREIEHLQDVEDHVDAQPCHGPPLQGARRHHDESGQPRVEDPTAAARGPTVLRGLSVGQPAQASSRARCPRPRPPERSASLASTAGAASDRPSRPRRGYPVPVPVLVVAVRQVRHGASDRTGRPGIPAARDRSSRGR